MEDKNIAVSYRDILHTEDILRRHIPENHPSWDAIRAALNIERCQLQIESARQIIDRSWFVTPEEEWASTFEEYWWP